MVVVVGNTVEGIINNYKAKVEVLVEVYFKVIARRSAIFVRNRIAS
jgi:competence CoiA-like predicted nuclease